MEGSLLIPYPRMKPGTGLTFPDMMILFVKTQSTVQRSNPIGTRCIHLLLDLLSACEYFCRLACVCTMCVPGAKKV